VTLGRSRLLGNLIFTGPESGNIVFGVFTPVLAKHSNRTRVTDLAVSSAMGSRWYAQAESVNAKSLVAPHCLLNT